ncbi:PREDICTED: protein HEG homolog 1 [Elephantulus edwardii]|uniref:protein HEG homolog 1 n=1 Tax=Elephantulus edwardii TaxID=28737 RepID=UPI0003F0BF53|nr:PREDICTED: protein HEG homolog 1 [Elephantulus edwardii]
MASRRASRGPPLPLLLLLPLLLPALGARGPHSTHSGAPLAGAGLVQPPETVPERELQLPPRGESRGPARPRLSQTPSATRRGPSGQAPRAAVRNHWQESNTEPHLENVTSYQGQVNFSTVISKEPVMGQVPRTSHFSSDAPVDFTSLTEAANAGGRSNSQSRTDFTSSPVAGSPEIATALDYQNNTSAVGDLGFSSSSSSSESEEKMAVSQTERGVPPGSLDRGRGLPEEATVHSQAAATSALSQSSPSALERIEQTTSSRKRNSSRPEVSPPRVSRVAWTNPLWDEPASSESTKELSSFTAFKSPLESQTKNKLDATTFTDSVPRVPQSSPVSLRPSNETEDFPKDSKISTTSASVHSPPSSEELGGNSRVTENLGNEEHVEPSTENAFGFTSSEIVMGFWQSDSPTLEGHPLVSSSATSIGSSISQTESVSKSVPSSEGGGESPARWSTTNSSSVFVNETRSSTSAPEAVNSSVFTQFSESAPQSAGSTLGERPDFERSMGIALFTSSSESLDPLASRGERSITGVSYDHLSGTDIEQRTSGHHTDHSYVSSTFTKGERTLLSITDNSSSSDTMESSTSYIKIFNSSHLESSSSSHVQTGQSNASSYGGGYAQPSTESLLMRTPSPPSYTSTVNVPNTLALLNVDNSLSVDNSSSSTGPLLPLPSVSQSHHLFSSALSSTRPSAPVLKSTSGASLSSSPSPLTLSMMASAAVPSTPVPSAVSSTASPRSSSTPILPSARETSGTSVRMWTVASPMEMLPSSQTAAPEYQIALHQDENMTEPESPSLVSSTASPTEAVTVSTSGARWPQALTESSIEDILPTTSTSLAQMSPALRATTQETSHPPVTTVSLPSNTAALTGEATVIQTSAGKQALPTSAEFVVPQITTQGTVTTKRTQVHVDMTTRWIPLTSAPTSPRAVATGDGVTEEHSPAVHFSRPSPSPQTIDAATTQVLTTTSPAQGSTLSTTTLSSPASVNSCATNPCLHNGRCVADATSGGYRCMCSPSWQGDDCSVDVNECLSNPCPPQATCNNTQGSFTCKCPVGYQLEKGICNLVRTFVTEFKLKKTFFNTTVEEHSDLREIENKIIKTLNGCFSTLPGYARSTACVSAESSMLVISLQTTFSLASNVTLFDLADSIQKCVNSCGSSAEICQLLGSQRRVFRAGSLCKRKSPECDRETSICTDLDGVALCQCKSGYFHFNKLDHSCRACEDGYRLENKTCMSCPFGLGGLNCGNPYQLITVVIAAAGGGLLLILGIALIVTCCRKNKNDISKLIFKSGDFQMSPYAEYPKNPRSHEWGREAIEMHENGSTKNLLQVTDVYYSPAGVRNPELERNGLYPAYTGLPGSRHSCIFPGQYNPSFISDESRRRDYF